jgi:hypothetical protein
MKIIKEIILNLRTKETQEFDILNKKLQMEWTLRFEFIDGDICMIINESTLTAVWFETIEEIEAFLKDSFLSKKEFELM